MAAVKVEQTVKEEVEDPKDEGPTDPRLKRGNETVDPPAKRVKSEIEEMKSEIKEETQEVKEEPKEVKAEVKEEMQEDIKEADVKKEVVPQARLLKTSGGDELAAAPAPAAAAPKKPITVNIGHRKFQ